jgi:cell wall-associated NlpC family hydrolase
LVQAPLVVIVLAVSCVIVASASADPGTVASKQAQAQQVLAQIQGIDAQLERAVEAYDLANVKLHRIERDIRENRHDLHIAKANLARAQKLLSARLVDIYTSSEEATGLGVLLGATSFNDFVNRLDAVDSVSHQDVQVVTEVRSFKHAVIRHARELKRAHAAQASVVAARAARRAQIQSQLSQRRALLSSIRGEIARMRAQERARQLAIAGAVRQRLATQPPPSPTATATVVGASAATPETTIAPPSRFGGVVGVAMRYLGVPYRWGGASPSGFDCSGFVMYVYAQVGVSLPHSSYAQYGAGVPVSRDQLQPGDLVFFNGLGHVGIYIGGNQMIHAPHTGDVVKISSLTGWYTSTYVGARRIT